MSVLIKGRKMPANCQECMCLNDEYFFCQAVGRKPKDEDLFEQRPEWCPLIDVVVAEMPIVKVTLEEPVSFKNGQKVEDDI